MLLFQKRFHTGLVQGDVTVTFRRWDKPRVKPGGRYRCHPIGVLEVDRGSRLTLGDLFAVWGRPLSRTRLAGYRARRGEQIRAWVGGCPWHGPLGRIPLRRHAEIVLEGGGFVPPHATFLFPRGL